MTKSCGKLDELNLCSEDTSSALSPRVKTCKRISNLKMAKQTKTNLDQSQRDGLTVKGQDSFVTSKDNNSKLKGTAASQYLTMSVPPVKEEDVEETTQTECIITQQNEMLEFKKEELSNSPLDGSERSDQERRDTRLVSSRQDFVLNGSSFRNDTLFSKLFIEKFKKNEKSHSPFECVQDVSTYETRKSCSLSKFSPPVRKTPLTLSEPRLFGESREVLKQLATPQPGHTPPSTKSNLLSETNKNKQIDEDSAIINTISNSHLNDNLTPSKVINLQLTLQFLEKKNGNWNVHSASLRDGQLEYPVVVECQSSRSNQSEDLPNKKAKDEKERKLNLVKCKHFSNCNCLADPKKNCSYDLTKMTNFATLRKEHHGHLTDILKASCGLKDSKYVSKNLIAARDEKTENNYLNAEKTVCYLNPKGDKINEIPSQYFVCLPLSPIESCSKPCGYMTAGAESIHHRETPVVEVVNGNYGSDLYVYSGANSVADSYHLPQKSPVDYFEHPGSSGPTGDGQSSYHSVQSPHLQSPHLQSPQLLYYVMPQQPQINSQTMSSKSSGFFSPQHSSSNYSDQKSKLQTTKHFVHCSTPQSSRSQLYVIKNRLICPKPQYQPVCPTPCNCQMPSNRTLQCCVIRQPTKQCPSRPCSESIPVKTCYICKPQCKEPEREKTCCLLDNTHDCCADVVCEEETSCINTCSHQEPRKPCLVAPPQPLCYCCTRIPLPECCCSGVGNRSDSQEQYTVIDKLISIINNSISAFSVLLSQRKNDSSLPPSLQRIMEDALPKKSSIRYPASSLKSSKAPLEESLARLLAAVNSAASKAPTSVKSPPNRTPLSSRTPSSAYKSNNEHESSDDEEEDTPKPNACTEKIDYTFLEGLIRRIIKEQKLSRDTGE